MQIDVKSALPWIVGGAVVVGGVYLFKRGTGTSSGVGFSTVAPPDITPSVQAASQLEATRLNAESQAFEGILGFVNNRQASEFALANQIEQDNTALSIRQADNAVQLSNIRAQESTAKHNSTLQAIGSIVGSLGVVAAIAFCYDDTAKAQANYRVYTHGRV
jgi:hypothetical protein